MSHILPSVNCLMVIFVVSELFVCMTQFTIIEFVFANFCYKCTLLVITFAADCDLASKKTTTNKQNNNECVRNTSGQCILLMVTFASTRMFLGGKLTLLKMYIACCNCWFTWICAYDGKLIFFLLSLLEMEFICGNAISLGRPTIICQIKSLCIVDVSILLEASLCA